MIRQLTAADRALSNAPEHALELVRASERRFADGYLREERRYVAVMALIALGRIAEARTEAAQLLARQPSTPYRSRIERAFHDNGQ